MNYIITNVIMVFYFANERYTQGKSRLSVVHGSTDGPFPFVSPSLFTSF